MDNYFIESKSLVSKENYCEYLKTIRDQIIIRSHCSL